jgi:hypothetical protein
MGLAVRIEAAVVGMGLFELFAKYAKGRSLSGRRRARGFGQSHLMAPSRSTDAGHCINRTMKLNASVAAQGQSQP